MRLEKASAKAIRYACMMFHYAKSVPVNPFGFSVLNGSGDWCGVVLFSAGANARIGMPYGLAQGAVIELVRVALNGKQESTSKALALAVRFLSRAMPTVKLIVSYADTEQDHVGTLYQACNWIYVDKVKSTPKFYYKGRWIHNRQADSLGLNKSELQKRQSGDKLKYLYPMNKEIRKKVEQMSKPYPKKHAAVV